MPGLGLSQCAREADYQENMKLVIGGLWSRRVLLDDRRVRRKKAVDVLDIRGQKTDDADCRTQKISRACVFALRN